MALQTRNLSMLGLGVRDEVPPDTGQPTPLVDGIHLRWDFPPERGFPSYGFHLFRRKHEEGSPLPLSAETQSLQPGRLPTNRLTTPLGEIASDANLVLTDDFVPEGTVEFDLQDRKYPRCGLSQEDPVRRVDALIGFRRGAIERPAKRLSAKRTCITFGGRTPGQGPNPRTEQSVTFRVSDQHGRPRPHTTIREKQTGGGEKRSGLDCEWELEIVLPEAPAEQTARTDLRRSVSRRTEEDN